MNSDSAKLTAMNPDAKLGMLERIAYGMGDFGGNLIYTAISSFLLVYYVSVVGIPAAAAGTIKSRKKESRQPCLSEKLRMEW